MERRLRELDSDDIARVVGYFRDAGPNRLPAQAEVALVRTCATPPGGSTSPDRQPLGAGPMERDRRRMRRRRAVSSRPRFKARPPALRTFRLTAPARFAARLRLIRRRSRKSCAW